MRFSEFGLYLLRGLAEVQRRASFRNAADLLVAIRSARGLRMEGVRRDFGGTLAACFEPCRLPEDNKLLKPLPNASDV